MCTRDIDIKSPRVTSALHTGDVSDGLLQLMQNFISETPTDHKEKMSALCRIFCPETKPEEKGLRVFYQEVTLFAVQVCSNLKKN